MARWLVKADPDDYGFAQLARDKKTRWDGIKNPAALGHLRAMKKGDDCLVYETGGVKAIVGRATVASAPKSDAKNPQDNPKLVSVELEARGSLARPLPLAEIKADPAFAQWELVRISRLSVMPVPEPLWKRIEKLTR